MSRVDLLTVGEAFDDLIFAGLQHLPRAGEEVKTRAFVRAPGGGAVITAVAAARLGLRCAVVSAMSPGVAEALRREGVGIRNLRRRDEPPALSVALSTSTDRSFVTFSGVNDSLEPRLVAPVRRPAARHVHFAFYPRRCGRWVRVLARLAARRVSTSWDFGWNEGLRDDPDFTRLVAALDYVFLNEAESIFYARTRTLNAAVGHWRACARNTIIKLGDRGCRWVRDGWDLAASARRVRAVETTGAGDAFNGGFLYGVLTGRTPRDCLRLGNFVGARSTRAPGGLSGLPERADLGRLGLRRPAGVRRSSRPAEL